LDNKVFLRKIKKGLRVGYEGEYSDNIDE